MSTYRKGRRNFSSSQDLYSVACLLDPTFLDPLLQVQIRTTLGQLDQIIQIQDGDLFPEGIMEPAFR
jgi:hypothetical protein